MRHRFSCCGAGLLLTVFAAGVPMAAAGEPGRLSAFAARQAIRDEVCIAMADGSLSPGDRYAILTHAKQVLKPEEYQGLKRSLDRISPPKPTRAKPGRRPSSQSQPSAAPTATAASLTMPWSALLPDRIALWNPLR